MTGIIAKVFIAMAAKLLTENFFAKVIVFSLNQVSESTSNKLDDKICKAVAEALNVKLD